MFPGVVPNRYLAFKGIRIDLLSNFFGKKSSASGHIWYYTGNKL